MRFKYNMWGRFSLRSHKNFTGVSRAEREARGCTRASASTPVARSVWTRLGPRDLRNCKFSASRKSFCTCSNPGVVQDSATTLQMATHTPVLLRPCVLWFYPPMTELHSVLDDHVAYFRMSSERAHGSPEDLSITYHGHTSVPLGTCLIWFYPLVTELHSVLGGRVAYFRMSSERVQDSPEHS